jgi:small subunit ribosomal protein S1
LSIKQAAEGGVVAAEYQEAFGEHMYDAEGNYIGPSYEYNPDELTEDQQAWAEYYAQHPELDPGQFAEGEGVEHAEGNGAHDDVGAAPADQS